MWNTSWNIMFWISYGRFILRCEIVKSLLQISGWRSCTSIFIDANASCSCLRQNCITHEFCFALFYSPNQSAQSYGVSLCVMSSSTTFSLWRHQLETFSASLAFVQGIHRWHFPRNWPFVRGIHRSLVNSPHKGQWRGALMFSLICARINGWDNDEAGDFRRHYAHYDVIVICRVVQSGMVCVWRRCCCENYVRNCIIGN